MDPYVEIPERWRNVHNNLATETQAQLAPLIRPRYYADQEPRSVYDTGLGVAARRQGLPDVSVIESPSAPSPPHPEGRAQRGSMAIAPAPLELLIASDLLERLNTVVIRTVEGDELVTVMEILGD